MKRVLLMVDMSNDFVADDGGLTVGKPAQYILPYIVEQANHFLEAGDLVVVTMDAHQPNDDHFKMWNPHNVTGTLGQELYGELKEWYEQNKENKDVKYIPKTNYNAFFKTDLGDILRKDSVEEVHVVGVTTDICVYLTAAGADAEGFKTVVHSNGVATFTDKQEDTLEQMKLVFHTKIVE